MVVFDFWRNGSRNVHFLMASIENHPFVLLIHEIFFFQGQTLRLEAQLKESGQVHQSMNPKLTNLDGIIMCVLLCAVKISVVVAWVNIYVRDQ